MFHLYGGRLHSDAEVLVRGDVRHADSFILNFCRRYWFVLVQVEYARHTDRLDEGMAPLGLALCVSIWAASSCVTGAVTLLVGSGWRRKHIWSVFSHVLHQICFLQTVRERYTLGSFWKRIGNDSHYGVLRFLPRYMCGCINHRSRACRAWLCEWTDEPPGWLRLHNHGCSGDTYTVCPCCADADETVIDRNIKLTVHPTKKSLFTHTMLLQNCQNQSIQ